MSKKETDPRRKEVPPLGNLGLLAYGHKGVEAWRKAREEASKKASDNK